MCRSSQFSPRCPTCTRYVTSGSSPRAISRSSRCAVDAAVPAAAVAPVPGVPLFPMAARVGVHHTRTAREQSLAVFRVSRAPLVCGCILFSPSAPHAVVPVSNVPPAAPQQDVNRVKKDAIAAALSYGTLRPDRSTLGACSRRRYGVTVRCKCVRNQHEFALGKRERRSMGTRGHPLRLGVDRGGT